MNEIDTIKTIGYMATILTTASWWPQLVKTYKTKNVDGLSKAYFGLLSVGLMFWLLYGVLIEDLPLIITNVFGGSVCIYVFYQIIRQERIKKGA